MHNIRTYTSADAIDSFVYSLWKTDEFRLSHTAGGFIGKVVEQFTWLPRLFYTPSHDYLERAHFSTWWGAIALRDDYTNPFIHDLYLLHEFYHAAHMPYIPNIGKAAFDEKMQRNELEASVLSEIQVYFEMPELRAQSFQHPIYADRFLHDPTMQALWKVNRPVAVETIRAMRRDVMVSKPEHLLDFTEQWIRRFAEQNAVYSLTWSERYPEIERHMLEFQIAAASDRQAAIDAHSEWLVAEASKDELDYIPFRREAELFAPFYWANKERYDAAAKASRGVDQ